MLNAMTWGRFVGLLIAAAALAFLFVAFEGWRGKAAFERYADESAARGMSIDLESFIPPPVSDSENFAQTPALAPLFDFIPGTQKWRDTNATSQIMALEERFRELARQNGYEISKNRHPRYEIATRLDLVGLFETNSTTKGSAGGKHPIPSTREEAARTLIALIEELGGPILDELQASSQNAVARFNIQYDSAPVSGILLPHLSVVKNRAQLLALRAVSRLALGETNQAFEDLRLILYLSDTFKGEPFLISHLVRLSCRNFATAVLWQGMIDHRWSDAQLRQLQTGLLADNFPLDGYRVLQGERAGNVRLIHQLRARAGGLSLDQVGFADNDGAMVNVAHTVIPSGWYYLEALNLCRCYDQFLPAMDEWLQGKQDYRAVVAKTTACSEELSHTEGDNPLFVVREVLWNHRLLARMLIPGVTRMFAKTIQAQARTEQMIGACALERYFLEHGQYPESIDQLIPGYLNKSTKDPFTKEVMKFHRDAANAYTLYSVGPNGQDDGGIVDVDKKGVVNSEKGDLVWKMGPQ